MIIHKNTTRRNNRLRLAAVLGILIFFFIVLLNVENMLSSFLLAFVIFYLHSPFVNYLERRGLPRNLSTTLLFACGFGLISLAIKMMLPLIGNQIGNLRAEAPRYIAGLTQLIETTESRMNEALGSVYVLDISQSVSNNMLGWTTSFFESLPGLASQLLTTSILAPFFAFFMLLDGRKFSRALLAVVPNNLFELALHLVHQLNRQMGDFIRARLLEALIVGLVVWGGLELLDFRYAYLLALFAALTNLIPYIGPLIGAVPALLIAFINGSDSLGFLLLLSVYGIAQLIDMLFIIPLVVAKIVDLHPITVVIVIIIGSQLLGIIGMIISIPVASATKLVMQSVYTQLIHFRR